MKTAPFAGMLALAAWLVPFAGPQLPTAAAQPCPDVQVVFARGTSEPPGVGATGQGFVDALRSQLGGRSVEVYAVDYPASKDFDRSTAAGAADMTAHVQAMAARCPATRIVVGGYSQGAVVTNLATASMSPGTAEHVAASALLGGPSGAFATTLSSNPLPGISPLLSAKTIDLCAQGDPICSSGFDTEAHGAYVRAGLANQAAVFAAGRI
jgi:cutinase